MNSGAAAVQAAGEFRMLPLADVVESRTNPRQTFSKARMDELVASVRSKGVLQPVVVRPKGARFEIVAGARRCRASKLAGMEAVPAIVRTLTDAEALEVQLLENLVREDVPPMEEAAGFARLIREANYTPELIAERIGHDVKYVRQRLKYAELIPEACKLFNEDKINIGHANLLARLPAEQQKRAIKECLFYKAGRWEPSSQGGERYIERQLVLPVGEFDKAIRMRVYLDLSGAPWKKDDPDLLPAAGPCTLCLKRTGANKLLFDDLPKSDMCLDGACYAKKADAYLVQVEAAAVQAGVSIVRISESHGTPKNGALPKDKWEELKKGASCEYAQVGIFVDGPRRGQKASICCSAACKQHKGRFYSGVPRTSSGKIDIWKQRAQALPRKIQVETRRAQVAAILDACVTPLSKGSHAIPHGLLQVIASALLGYVPPELGKALGSFVELKDGRTDVGAQVKKIVAAELNNPLAAHLGPVVVALALSENVKEFCVGAAEERLKQACAALKVNATGIAKRVSKTLRAEFQRARAKAKGKKGKKAAVRNAAKRGGARD